MVHLFSPIRIAHKQVLNRIVMAPLVSGYAMPDGFVSDALYNYYVRRADGGVGLIITEPARVLPPPPTIPDGLYAHLGLYADAFVPNLRRVAQAVHSRGTRLIITLDAPAEAAQGSTADLQALAESFIQAAWRALAADCDGIMLSAADNGVLHTLVSPLHNRRADTCGGTLTERLRLPLQIVQGMRAWMGTRLIVGFRLIAEDFVPDGIHLHDARVIAKRMVAAGVDLLDVTVDMHTSALIARFPGWCVPLADSIKRVISDIPIIGSGQLGDPYVANSVIREGSVDFVMLGKTLQKTPDWPLVAHSTLFSNADRTDSQADKAQPDEQPVDEAS